MENESLVDTVMPYAIVIGGAALLSLISPWLLVGAAGVIGYRWWSKWRYEDLRPAETRWLVDWTMLPTIDGCKYMYLGTTQEGTIRWWYYNGYLYPQAVDNNQVYWDKRIHVEDEVLRKHLEGFFEMGNEWPEYYRTVVVPKDKSKRIEKMRQMNAARRKKYAAAKQQQNKKRKNGDIKVVPSSLPRADYAIDEARPAAQQGTGTAAWAADVPLMELVETVKELEKDATGSCPSIDFDKIRNAEI